MWTFKYINFVGEPIYKGIFAFMKLNKIIGGKRNEQHLSQS